MSDLLIRDLAPATHGELQRRANEVGMSVQAYVSRLLDEHAARPSFSEWALRLRELPSHPHVVGAELVEAARDELL